MPRDPSNPPAPKRRAPRRRTVAIGVACTAIVAIGALARMFIPRVTGEPQQRRDVIAMAGPVDPAPRPVRVVAFEDGCASAECHASYLGAQGVHAPVSKGECDECHEPDAGDHTYPIASASGACLACHDLGGPRLHEHSAMTKEGCLACHDPHRSDSPFLLLGASVEAACARCHPQSDGRVQHQPYHEGDCTVCHDAHAADVPALLRGGDGSEHCAMCHGEIIHATETSVHTHRDIEGGCLACHDAHAADHDGLLTAPGGDHCLRCHDDVGREVTGASVTHQAVLQGERCLACHDPHASDHPMMLRDDEGEVCMRCHDQPQVTPDGRDIPAMADDIMNRAFTHGPVRANDCAACHSVHGGQHARLLREVSSDLLSGAFDVRNYALCFACHDQALVLNERTPDATAFRDGDRNLHFAHVTARERGRSCTNCHAVHASDQPRHIAEHVAYEGSDWLMPIGFVLTPDGGSCSPGCHEPLSYSRDADRGDRQGGPP